MTAKNNILNIILLLMPTNLWKAKKFTILRKNMESIITYRKITSTVWLISKNKQQ